MRAPGSPHRSLLGLIALSLIAPCLAACGARATVELPNGDVVVSHCPASRDPIPLGDPRLVAYWRAAAAFDRTRHGFSVLPDTGDVIWDRPSDGKAAIVTCQSGKRIVRSIFFRVGGADLRWIGEQQTYRSGRTYQDPIDGELLEAMTFDYEIEPVAGFPLNQLNISYSGKAPGYTDPFKGPTLQQAQVLLRSWGLRPNAAPDMPAAPGESGSPPP